MKWKSYSLQTFEYPLCIRAKEVGGVLSNNGGMLFESEGINGIFVHFSVLESE